MLATLSIVLPIFALIFTGWLARRLGALGPQATRELNRFVVYLALPALLFDIVANASFDELWQPGFILAFGGGCLIIYLATLTLRLVQSARLADAAIDGLNASYANTGYMGFPLMLAAFGEAGLPPTLIATIITVCAIFAVAIVLIESSTQEGAGPMDVARKTARALLTNPLLIAPFAGAIVLITGWTLPKPIEVYLDFLGSAASPCALIALGLFLAGTTEAGGQKPARQWPVMATLSGLKLVGQPLITWLIAAPLLGLPEFAVHAAVLIAALPTGTGSFMLAEFYGREARLTGQTVLVTTILSIATISAYLSWIGISPG